MYAARFAISSGFPSRPVGILSIIAFSKAPVGSRRLNAPWTQQTGTQVNHRQVNMSMWPDGQYLGSYWSRLDYVEPVAIAPPLCSQRPDTQQPCYHGNHTLGRISHDDRSCCEMWLTCRAPRLQPSLTRLEPQIQNQTQHRWWWWPGRTHLNDNRK